MPVLCGRAVAWHEIPASMRLAVAAGALVAAASDLSFNAMGYLAVLGNDLMTCEGSPPCLRAPGPHLTGRGPLPWVPPAERRGSTESPRPAHTAVRSDLLPSTRAASRVAEKRAPRTSWLWRAAAPAAAGDQSWSEGGWRPRAQRCTSSW